MKFLKIFLIIATVAYLGYVAFIIWFGLAWAKGEERARQSREDLRSGKEDFGDQPALFTVAQAVVADALHLLECGADPNRAAPDGMTFAKMLAAHRERFARENKKPPPDFQQLWDWAQSRSVLPPG